jgi:putative (di)nucleoside polyphosphate hydrolase
MDKLLGIVRKGQFEQMTETGVSTRLTEIAPQESVLPETKEKRLDDLEGKVIMVEGQEQDGWIYSARIDSTQQFRANVGIVLINDQGEVLKVERSKNGKPSGEWQMPQGGLDDLEEPKEAAERELNEELGLDADLHVEFLQEHPEWLAYELPEEVRRKLAEKVKPDELAKHGRGQVQKWFLARFMGDEDDIKLEKWAKEHGGEPEFAAKKWTTLSALAEETWEVRRPIYRRLAADFAHYLQ